MKGHFLTGFFARALIAFFNLGVLLICSRYLGSGVLGEMSLLIVNLAIIQAIADIYNGPALVYFIPRSRLRNIYRHGIFWSLCTILPINLIFYAFHIGPAERWPDTLILSFLVCGTAFHNVILLGRQKIRAYFFLLFIQPALMFCTIAAGVFGADMTGSNPYLLALYISWTVAFVISLLLFLQESQQDDDSLPVELPGAIISKGFTNQLANLAHILSNRFNYYVLAVFAAVGVYAGATSLIESVWIVSAAVSPALLSHIANRQREKQQRMLTLRLARACAGVSLLFVIAVFLVPSEFFTWLLGRDFTGVKQAMLLLSPGVLAVSFSSIISHYYSGRGMQRVLLAANCSGLAVTLLFSYFLVSRYGIAGAAITATLAYGAQSVFLTIKFIKDRPGAANGNPQPAL